MAPRITFLTGGLLLAIAFLAPAHAQLLPVRLEVDACTIEAPASLEAQAHALAGRAAGILPRLERRLGVQPKGRFRMVLIPRAGVQDAGLAPLDGSAPAWAAGYMMASRRIGAIRVALAQRYPYGTVESVFAHEVTHLLLHDALGDNLPRWFNEGVATREGRRWGVQDMLVHTSTLLTADVPLMQGLESSFQGSESRARLAYAASFAFVSWAETHYGPQFIADVVRHARTQSFDRAWQEAAGMSLADSEGQWRGETLLRYRWIPIIAAGSMLWAMLGLLVFVGGLRKKARARAVRAKWAAHEEIEASPSDSEGPGSL